METQYVLPDHPLDALLIDGSFSSVAVLSDVHGNLPALEACLADVEREAVDAVLFLGDLTWGPQPREVLALARDLPVPTWFVRGNAERAVLEFAAGTRETERLTDDWMVEAHGPDGVAQLGEFPPALRISVGAVGGMRLCHGSPRSDMELFTPQTPAVRVALATAGVDEPTIGHGHTHLQYRRAVGERTLFGPGSVGLPYGTDGRPGARWALVGDDIRLRVSPYDIESSIEIAAPSTIRASRTTRSTCEPRSRSMISSQTRRPGSGPTRAYGHGTLGPRQIGCQQHPSPARPECLILET